MCIFFFPSRIFLRIPQAGLALFALSVKHPGFHSNLVSSPKHTSVKLKGWFLAENTNGSFERTIHTPFCSGQITKAVTVGLSQEPSAHLGTLPIMPSTHSTPAKPHSWGWAGIYPPLSTRHGAWCCSAWGRSAWAVPSPPRWIQIPEIISTKSAFLKQSLSSELHARRSSPSDSPCPCPSGGLEAGWVVLLNTHRFWA